GMGARPGARLPPLAAPHGLRAGRPLPRLAPALPAGALPAWGRAVPRRQHLGLARPGADPADEAPIGPGAGHPVPRPDPGALPPLLPARLRRHLRALPRLHPGGGGPDPVQLADDLAGPARLRRAARPAAARGAAVTARPRPAATRREPAQG